MVESSKPFGYYLKAKRQQLGLSQSDLADKTKIQRTSISRLESMSGNPQWSMIRLIAEQGMGISVSEFFQVEPVESRQPIIQIGPDIPGGKYAEVLLRTQGKTVPIVESPTPLRSGVVTDNDIGGYCILDQSMVKRPEKKLVAIRCEHTGKKCSWLIVDMEDREIVDKGVSLVMVDDEMQPRTTWLSPKGTLILEPLESNGAAPIAYWGRQRDRLEVLGRVVMVATEFP